MLKKPYHVPVAWCPGTLGRERCSTRRSDIAMRSGPIHDIRHISSVVLRWLLGQENREATPNPQLHDRETKLPAVRWPPPSGRDKGGERMPSLPDRALDQATLVSVGSGQFSSLIVRGSTLR